MKKRTVLNVLAKKYTYNILKALKERPRRFKDISQACANEKMRSERLKELEKFNLIKVRVERIKGRAVSIYEISEKGLKTLKLAEDIKRLHKEL
ncbi:MAG: helix-turn-helix transcriptional regulator [Candidatus Micrarchaeota archaeon]|nr:helix-turn-helix transcriptional regulator [Candidatus Micrarchaeota archaeon]